MKKEYKIPCDRCVLMALCRTKEYIDMIESCSLVRDILYDDRDMLIMSDNFDLIYEIQDILKPILWYTGIGENNDSM